MKNFLLVIGAEKLGANDQAAGLLACLTKSKLFDCVIGTVHSNLPGEEQRSGYGDHSISCNTYSAYSSELVALLAKENGGALPECVYIAGFDLERCVLMTAADLHTHGIRPIVLTAYCGSSGGEEAIFAGTRTLESLIGKNNICPDPINSLADLEKCASIVPSVSKAQALVDTLYQKGWRISFAESCTGGRAAAGIVDIASASTVLDASFVTYANEAKVRFLGVSPDTIQQHGVVSEPVAGEMAIGAAKEAAAQVGVGISGIAGPGGATPTKPVGMVCFGFYIDGKTYTQTVQFGAIGRNAVRQAAVDFVYSTLLELL